MISLPESSINAWKGHEGYSHDEGNCEDAWSDLVEENSEDWPHEHDGGHYEGVLVMYDGLIVEGSLHLVDDVAEGGSHDAGKYDDGGVLGEEIEEHDENHNTGSSSSKSC